MPHNNMNLLFAYQGVEYKKKWISYKAKYFNDKEKVGFNISRRRRGGGMEYPTTIYEPIIWISRSRISKNG